MSSIQTPSNENIASRFLADRNSLLAGNAGTPLNIGRPQTRWVDGVDAAAAVLKQGTKAATCNNAITIGTIIRRAINDVQSFARVPGWLSNRV